VAHRARPRRSARGIAAALAFAATLLGQPASAVTYPDVPLQSGQTFPPANIMFVLDDSGSMSSGNMPDTFPWNTLSGSGISSYYLYTVNLLSYNPNISYKPWLKSDGTRYTGGTSYTAAYTSASALTGSTNLQASTKTFYVPKTAGYAGTDSTQYDRYQILTSGNVVRSEWANSGPTGVTGVGCTSGGGYHWRGCTYATPTGRSNADERTNYATWYSYYRTRTKTAKGSAAEAFGALGDNIRVGFNTIWNRLPYPIPVGNNDGKFSGTNRDDWYANLFAAIASGGTPLLPSLQRTGNYFTDTSTSGPWGPEAGAAQLQCRQNFTILTTDGYWNSTTGYTPLGDQDGVAGPTNARPDGSTYTYNPARPYMDYKDTSITRANTLADVAMYYWKNDLRTDMDNIVPTTSADPAFWQHMVTFSVSIGLQGTLNPATDLPAITNGSKWWPDPLPAENATRIDDLWHAAVNGHGNFVVASDPVSFAKALSDALNTIATRLASASNVSANSTSFQTDTRVYQASYLAGKWTGELAAYPASSAGVSATPAWKASTLIPAWGGRKIYTWDGSAGVAFPTSAQVTALDQSGRVLSPATGTENANYLRGDQSKELANGGQLRDRSTVLGDIANSSPVYLKDNDTLFVGANDGMLHAFNGTTGVEQFAYVPAGLNLTDLASLSDPYYTHKFFVDGPVVVSTQAQTPGVNYLVGALGRGGRGVFGLDVTTPSAFATTNVKWQFNSDADIGNVLGQPLIVKLNDGTSAVIISNGINSPNGDAVLLILNLATGAVVKRIDTGVGSDNGLSEPRGWDNDGNGTVDYVYAGDLKGNLWKFDLTGASSAVWGIANGGLPMFVAKDAANNPQPITAGLALAKDTATGNRWVFFGTGSYLTTPDVTDASTQTVYGLIDSGTTIAGRPLLQTRSIVVTGTVAGKPVRAFEANGTLTPGLQGWYVDLNNPASGERVVTRPIIRGGALIFASIKPSTTACDAAGSGFVNALDAFTGTSLPGGFFDLDGDGVYGNETLTSGSNTIPIGSVDLGIGMPTLPIIIDNLLVVGGSRGEVGSVSVLPGTGTNRRVSWREIVGD
jgi:type IV pilus assembly protein PilY1